MSREDDHARLELLEDAVVRLREAAAGAIVVVEGARDRTALERLGVGGMHVQINRGHSIETFIDQIAALARREARDVVLVPDWDRTGGRLFSRLYEGLRARVRVDADSRRRLSVACQNTSLETVPAELAALRRRVGLPWESSSAGRGK